MGGSHGLRNKQVPYDESLRVPLIFRFPGRVPEGVQFDGAISLLDVAPTTLGLAGVSGVGNFRRNDSAMGLDQSDGILQAGATVSEPARDAVLVRWNDTRFSFGNHPYRALRSPSHTLVIGASDDFCLLFDRDEDPLELRNLYGHPGYRPLQRKLVSRLLELLAEGGEPPPDYVLQRLAQDSGAGPP